MFVVTVARAQFYWFMKAEHTPNNIDVTKPTSALTSCPGSRGTWSCRWLCSPRSWGTRLRAKVQAWSVLFQTQDRTHARAGIYRPGPREQTRKCAVIGWRSTSSNTDDILDVKLWHEKILRLHSIVFYISYSRGMFVKTIENILNCCYLENIFDAAK